MAGRACAEIRLGFTIIDRDYLAAVRRNYGFTANPWAVGSRFILSHNLLADETYSDGVAELLRPFRPRAMLILDEAHHAAPASGIAYATDSNFTVAVRRLAELFEHRLFLSATRTMATPTASLRCWKSSIPSDLPAACR